jgi:hypothetical protein
MQTLQDKINEAKRDLKGKYRTKNLIERLRSWLYRNIIDTKGGYLIVGIIIASAFTFITLEAPDYYNYVRIGYTYAMEGSVKDGAVVLFDRTGALGKEQSEIKIAEKAPSTSSPEDLIKKYFGEKAEIAMAIAKAESGMKHDAINVNQNGTFDCNIFQVNSIHITSIKQCSDTEENIKLAHEIFLKSGFNAWVVYKTGAYLKFM